MTTALLIGCSLLLVLANGFFVLAEFALVKVRSTRVEQLMRAGDARAAATHQALAHLDAYLSATQLGITLASLALGWIGEPAFASVFGGVLELVGLPAHSTGAHAVAAAFAFGAITFLHIVVGELAPKSMAIRKPEAMALFAALPMRFFYRVFYVPLWALNHASNTLLRLAGIVPVAGGETIASEEELKLVLGRSQAAGVLSFNRLLLVENAFDLGTLTVKDVMVPLARAVTLDLARPAELAALIGESKRTRYPVVEGTPPRIVGFVHLKDVALAALAGKPTSDLAPFVRPIERLRADLSLEVALRELQRRRVHLAAVEDEAKGAVGLITFKDIMEELVGDIEDEFVRDSTLRLSGLLKPEGVLLEPSVRDGRELIDRMFEAARALKPDLDVETARKAVWQREESAPTVLLHRIALPHARLEGLEHPLVVLARVKEGVPFGRGASPGPQVFLLLLTPLATPGVQLRLLRRVAQVLDSDFVRMRLLEAQTAQELLEAIRYGDADVHA